MSIVTRTGDSGTTALMYNRRLPKHHARVEAYGTVDELNSALGMARAAVTDPQIQATVAAIQADLIGLMGELATANEDLVRYIRDGYPRLTPDKTARLESEVQRLEAGGTRFAGWAVPGGTPGSAAMDFARTVARRAERRVCALQDSGEAGNTEIVIYLNRLSDLLWLLARCCEPQQNATIGSG